MTHDRVRRAVAVLFGVLSVFVAGCSSDTVLDEVKPAIDRALPPGAPALIRAEPADIPDWKKLWPADPGTLEALDQSLAYFAKPSSKKHFPYALVDGTVTHDRQVESLKTLRKILETSRTEREFEGWMNGAFDVYKSVGYDYDKGRLGGNVFFTAYYTPIFEGSRTADDVYRYPLYRRPAELAADDEGTPLGRRMPDGSIVPWPTRAEIDASGMFAGTELLWLKDPFEVYIVHVQGSARVRMQDGEIVHVGYHGKTERPYRSVGQELVKRGKLKAEELNLARLREYFRQHPSEVASALGVNESYVFFQMSPPGPFGSLGARVTPWHTVATDKSIFPRGGLVVVRNEMPSKSGSGKVEPHVGLYFDQDTGGAIRAAGRCDVYVGIGEEAERIAGFTSSTGRLLYLFLKDRPVRP